MDTGPVAPILWASAISAPTAMGLLSLSKTVADAWASLMLEDEYLAIDSDRVAGLVSTMAVISLRP